MPISPFPGFPPGVEASDIDLGLATRAHLHTSHTPERRAEGEQKEYVSDMVQAWNQLTKRRPTTEADKQQALDDFEKFRQEYLKRTRELLTVRAGLASTLVTGPANFPLKQQQKRGAVYDKKVQEFMTWVDKAAKGLAHAGAKPSRVISSDSPTAVLELQAKIDKAKANQEKFKAINAIVKSKPKVTATGAADDIKKQRLMDELGLSESAAASLLKPDFAGRLGVPAYELTNNLANIKRMEARIAGLEREAARPEVTEEGLFDGGHIEENRDLNRLQLFFDDKPDQATRDKLKKAGFHWSPNEGAWQRQLNENARYAAYQVVGQPLAPGAPTKESAAEVEAPEMMKVTLPEEDFGTKSGIIARDNIGGTLYEYRVAKLKREGPEFNTQVRFQRPDGSYTPWEGASMGYFHTEKEAIQNFLPRYHYGNKTNLEPIHPDIKAMAEKRDREAKQLEASRALSEAKAIEDRRIDSERRDSLKREFAKAQFKTNVVEIKGAENKVLETQKGPSIGGLTITKVPHFKGGPGYKLTHNLTGHAASPEYPTLGHAKVAAYRLTQLADFNQGLKELQATGIPLGKIANRLDQDPYGDMSDILPTPKETLKTLEKLNKPAMAKGLSAPKTPMPETGPEVEKLEGKLAELRNLEKLGIVRSPREHKERVEGLQREILILKGEGKGKFLALTNTGPGGVAIASGYTPVEATPLKEFEAQGLDLFIHKDIINPKLWTVTEGKTGTSVITSSLDKKTAVKIAANRIDSYEKEHGKGAYLKLVDDTVKSLGGLSPRYGRIPPTFTDTLGLKGLKSEDIPTTFEGRRGLAGAEAEAKPEVKPAMPALLGPSFIKKDAPGVSLRAAEARFSSRTAGTTAGRQRRPELDNKRTAAVVAPAVAKTEADLKLQRKWFKHPNRLDFEGIDTAKGPVQPRRMKRTKL